MRNPRLFTDQPLTPGDQVVLKGNVAQHLGRVLRSRSGDHIALFNGDGQEFAAQVLTVSKGEVSVGVGAAASPQTESPVYTTLGLCLSKGDRFDWAIQKATELGVGAIAPLLSERVDFSVPPDRIEKRVAHWQQIAISVEVLPKQLDEQVAAFMVQGFGGVMTKLTAKQADYIGVGVDGPFKTDSYKY